MIDMHRIGHVLADAAVAGIPAGRVEHRLTTHHQVLMHTLGIGAAEREQLDAKLSGRKPFLDFVYSRTNAKGVRQYLMVSGEPLFDPAGRYTGYRGIGKDVTDSMHIDHESALTH